MNLAELPTMLENSIVSPNIMATIAIVVLAVAALYLMRHASKRYRERMKTSDLNGTRRDRIFRSFQVTVRYGVIAIAVIAIMQVNGVNISALAAGLGIIGIIVAFALQDALADLAMGARIVTDNYFTLGDTVRVGDYEGEVVAFSPQSTKINSTLDDTVLSISNRNLDRVVLLSTLNDIDIPLNARITPAQVEEIFAAAGERLIADNPAVSRVCYVGPQAFKEYWVDQRFRLWCEPRARWQAMRDARRFIMEELNARGLELAVPQMRIEELPPSASQR